MLKQKAHLLPDLSQPVQRKACDILAEDRNESGVGPFEADNQPQQYTLARTAPTQHGQSLSALHTQANAIENLEASECLVYVFH